MTTQPGRQEAIVEGRPGLTLRDENREAVADLIAELLIEALDDAALANGAAHGGESA